MGVIDCGLPISYFLIEYQLPPPNTFISMLYSWAYAAMDNHRQRPTVTITVVSRRFIAPLSFNRNPIPRQGQNWANWKIGKIEGINHRDTENTEKARFK